MDLLNIKYQEYKNGFQKANAPSWSVGYIKFNNKEDAKWFINNFLPPNSSNI